MRLCWGDLGLRIVKWFLTELSSLLALGLVDYTVGALAHDPYNFVLVHFT